jgi:Cd2+/Zn2+-exporting ATPase
MLSRLVAVYRNPADRRKWLTVASGMFITAALVVFYGFGQAAPWAPLMTIAAVLAGYDIALRAWASLRLRHLSIELLVIVAAVGALFIDNHWESAAVTFLFMLGAWLETRTMSRTRGALKALLDAAPSPPPCCAMASRSRSPPMKWCWAKPFWSRLASACRSTAK